MCKNDGVLTIFISLHIAVYIGVPGATSWNWEPEREIQPTVNFPTLKGNSTVNSVTNVSLPSIPHGQ